MESGNQSLSILTFVPEIEDDGRYLICRAENPFIPDSAIEDKWRLVVHREYPHADLISVPNSPSLKMAILIGEDEIGMITINFHLLVKGRRATDTVRIIHHLVAFLSVTILGRPSKFLINRGTVKEHQKPLLNRTRMPSI